MATDYSKWDRIDVSDDSDKEAEVALVKKPVSEGYPGPEEEETELLLPPRLQEEKISHAYPQEGGYKKFVKQYEPVLQQFASLPDLEAGSGSQCPMAEPLRICRKSRPPAQATLR